MYGPVYTAARIHQLGEPNPVGRNRYGNTTVAHPPKNKQTKTLGRSFSSFYFLIYLIPSATAAAAAGLFSLAKI